jgi:nucleoside-diphosphate-sugar epimerase
MTDIDKKYQQMLEPSPALVEDIANLKGDILILGAGGKMGPALAKLAVRATEVAGCNKKVLAASRFSQAGVEAGLAEAGVQTFNTDLLQPAQLDALPEVENVLYLAGTKFGTTGNEAFTWAMNTYLPGKVAEKFKASKIVVFSTGNVYPLVPVFSGGATEATAPEPLGEYAQSCLGRERIFQYQSSLHGTPLLIYRLNYANDVCYGTLQEIARSVRANKPINLSMGHINSIWQSAANEIAIRSLHHCSNPAKILNVTGPETISVKWAALEFAKHFGEEPIFINQEQDTALLSNAAESFGLFGYPAVTLRQMIKVIAEWLIQGGKTIDKPTHFQERSGKY